jgi:16S rRNA (cytosine1407-C5)-methyltransferase
MRLVNETSLPSQFLARLARIVPADQLDAVLAALARRPTTFRVNTLKTTRAALLAKLSAQGFQTDAVAWYRDAFVLRSKSKQELIETPMYAGGELYVQSLSSMIPPLVLQPKPGDKVCDLAAAPGSKTTQMAALMGNGGEIVANDRSRIRLYKLTANLKQQGVTNVRLARLQGEVFWKKYPEYFDKTLIDAPCSLEGRFDIADEKSYRDWSVRKVQALSVLQRHLLRSAVSATRAGGVIVYSTCTLAPEENEKVIDWLLDKERGAVEIEPVELAIENVQPGIARWERKDFSPRVRETVRILPSELMEGFYIAKLRKRRSTLK